MEGIGGKLRAARVQWQLTLREVEDRSARLADQWGNPAYKISASWLDRVEREDGGLSATKLIVLAVIYGLSAEQMLGMCTPANVDPAQFDKLVGYYQMAPNVVFVISRKGDRYFEYTIGHKADEMFPESQTKFFLKNVSPPAQFSFTNGRLDRLLQS